MTRRLLTLLVVLTLAGCAGTTARGEEGGAANVSGQLVVFAAASLTDGFSELAGSFEAANPGTEVLLNLGGSHHLAGQILSGAPADVFASADLRQMRRVDEAGLLSGAARVFASNRLTIAVEAGNPLGLSGLDDLARDDLVIVLVDDEAPAGRLTARVLASAGVRAEPDSLEPDVRSALSKVALGEADAAVVYRSDLGAADVDGIEIPAQHAEEAEYPIATVRSGANPGAASAFVEHVLSERGQALLERAGLSRP